MLSNWSQLLADAGDAAKEFEPLPDGDYLLKVTKSDHATTSTQKDMFKLVTEVIGGPHDKSKVFTNLVVSPENPNAMGFFFRNLAAIGVPAKFFDNNPTHAAVAAALVGKTFIGTVGSREWNNKISNEIKSFKKDPNAEGGAGAPAGFSGPPAPPMSPAVSAPVTPPVTAATVSTPPPAVETPAEAPASAPTEAPATVTAPSTEAPEPPF